MTTGVQRRHRSPPQAELRVVGAAGPPGEACCGRGAPAAADWMPHQDARMNAPIDPSQLKFGIGQPVSRKEDPVLLRGEGRFTDDLVLPGQAYAALVRSPYAHGVLNGIDTGGAAAMPGVLAILTGRDLERRGWGPCRFPWARRTGTAARRACRPSR
jgi:hypothetical protein